ncbi:hypothetical protein ACTXT7_017585 [Hymenolepis weldensis]
MFNDRAQEYEICVNLENKWFHTSNRELPSIAGGFNSVRGEKQHCQPKQVPAIHKGRVRRKKNTLKPEVINPSTIASIGNRVSLFTTNSIRQLQHRTITLQ